MIATRFWNTRSSNRRYGPTYLEEGRFGPLALHAGVHLAARRAVVPKLLFVKGHAILFPLHNGFLHMRLGEFQPCLHMLFCDRGLPQIPVRFSPRLVKVCLESPDCRQGLLRVSPGLVHRFDSLGALIPDHFCRHCNLWICFFQLYDDLWDLLHSLRQEVRLRSSRLNLCRRTRITRRQVLPETSILKFRRQYVARACLRPIVRL